MNEFQIIETFCTVDDFVQQFWPAMQAVCLEHKTSSHWWATREKCLSLSEIMAIAILFHTSGFRTFKQFYVLAIQAHLRKYFPKVPSYSWFVRLLSGTVFPLFVLSQSLLQKTEGIAFIDSTILTVCHIKRASSHRVFKGAAAKGKTSTGWFFGFKLHVVINHKGEFVTYLLTPGNIDDRKPVPQLTKEMTGKLFGDRGYISHLLGKELLQRGLELITRIRANMKNRLVQLGDAILLKKRGIIESVFNMLKSGCQIEHHRHRSRFNFLCNLISGLIMYSLKPHKPTLEELKLKHLLG